MSIARHRQPVVRAAQADDLDALVDIELAAFSDSYESPVDEQTVADVRQKFARRIDLLGQWARVLVAPDGDVVGMSLAYPISISRTDLIRLHDEGHNMADSDAISRFIDSSGVTLWHLNLAVAPSAPMLNGAAFFARSMRALRVAHGIEYTYFTCRLPGLARWAAAQVPGVNVAELPREQQEELAMQYVQSAIERGGGSRIADRLLALYVESGAIPIKLVSVWPAGVPARGYIDLPSLGYRVLCERNTGSGGG